MSILIIGADGNMGRRYQAILKYLGKPYECVDKADLYTVYQKLKRSSGVIIATPTDLHASQIAFIAPHKIPILCEKPISKDLMDLELALMAAKKHGAPLNMVYQYSVMADPKSKGESHYDFYNHGGDGLVWDCIQIIGLARGKVSLKEESPIWKCGINGKKLHIAHMNHAYVKFIESWLKSPGQDLSQIRDIHVKTHEMWEKNG